MSTINVGAIDFPTGVAVRSQAVNTQTGTTYTFIESDAGTLVSASNASAVTFTVPPQASVSWGDNTVLKVVNYGAGALTIDGGSGVTVTNTATTLAQFQSAAAIRTAENAWTLVPFSGGVGNADFSDAATGTYTDGGIDYKYKTYTGSGSVTITKAGLCDVLVVGGGGGGGAGYGGGGGAGSYVYATDFYLSGGSQTIVVGGGAAGTDPVDNEGRSGNNGSISRLGTIYAPGGGGGGNYTRASNGDIYGASGLSSGSGGGGAGGSGTSGGSGGSGLNPIGFNGGSGIATIGAGGGGGSRTGTGGSGGGGGGGITSATSGTANTGGGGGGLDNSNYVSGAGGSGVVIIRVRTN